MLDDGEKMQLRNLEQRLVQQDAQFVDRLRRRLMQLPPAAVVPADLRPLGQVLRHVAVLLTLLLLTGGSPGGALGMCLLTIVGQHCWGGPHVTRSVRRDGGRTAPWRRRRSS